MADSVTGVQPAPPGTAGDDSRGSTARPSSRTRRIADAIRDSGPFGWVLLVLGGGAGLAMIVTEFLTLSSFDIGITSCQDALNVTQGKFTKLCTTTGHQHHHWALVVLGLLAIAMTLGVVVGRSRPAAVALTGIGVAVLVIAVAIDHPYFDKTRGLELLFPQNQIHGKSGTGYLVEIAAGVAAIAAGGLGFLRKPVD